MQNHPFVEGNKRTAFIAAFAFLRINGWYLDAPEGEAEEMMLALSARRIDEGAFTEWLERRAVRS